MPRIKLYTTQSCPFCIAAKNLLKIKNLRFEEIDLTSRTELRLEISTKYNWRTVPLIIIDDKFIGGFDELDKLNDEGKLV
jgi:glutaredoxin 3